MMPEAIPMIKVSEAEKPLPPVSPALSHLRPLEYVGSAREPKVEPFLNPIALIAAKCQLTSSLKSTRLPTLLAHSWDFYKTHTSSVP